MGLKFIRASKNGPSDSSTNLYILCLLYVVPLDQQAAPSLTYRGLNKMPPFFGQLFQMHSLNDDYCILIISSLQLTTRRYHFRYFRPSIMATNDDSHH